MEPWGTPALMWHQFEDCPLRTTIQNLIVWVCSIFHILPNIWVCTSGLHGKLCQKLWISLWRPFSPLMMDLHQWFYRFHVSNFMKVVDAHKSHLGKSQINYCLLVYWCLSIQKEKRRIFSKTLEETDITDAG